jgi:hypothetical protein
MNKVSRIEVTDLYQKLYEIVSLIWNEPDFRGQYKPDQPLVGDPWYAVDAYLEENLFLAACSRRVYRLTGESLSLPEVWAALQVCDVDGNAREGDSGCYASTGFDWGQPDDDEILPLLVAMNLEGDDISDIRLFVKLEKAA